MSWVWWVIAGVSVVVIAGTVYYVVQDEEEQSHKTEAPVKKEKKAFRLVNMSNTVTLQGLEKDGVRLDKDGGKEFFSVEENLTTGYSWILRESNCSADILSIVSETKLPKEAGDMVGVPHTRYFTLTGVSEGDCQF